MGFYSFVVLAPVEVPLPDYLLYLEPGRNVFNVLLKTDLETFTNFLVEQGVQIIQTNRLDAHEPVPPEAWPPELDALNDHGTPLLPG